MRPDRPYEEILSDMKACVENDDQEYAHIEADNLLKEVALCSHLVTNERYEIVKLWDSVKKWYA